MMYQWKTIGTIVLVSTTQFACGNQTPQFLRSVDVSVTEQNSENFINLSAEVNLGNATLGSLSIPVYNPRNQQQLGLVTFGDAGDGNQKITVSLDATSVLSADPTLGQTLPNGLPIPPSLGVAQGSLLAYPILNDSRVYVGGDLRTSVVIGAAFTIPGLNISGVGIGGNLFFSQNFSPSLFGMAGVYLSPGSNSSGIAVFGKYTIPATPAATPASLVQARVAATSLASTGSGIRTFKVHGSMPKSGNNVINQNISSKGQNGLMNYFYGNKKVMRPR